MVVRIVAVLTLLMSIAACAPVPKPELAAAPQGAYALDKTHASVVFRVDHLNGISRYVGRFDEFDAALDFDPDNLEASRLEATLDAASINTGLTDFNDQLANHPKLFDARRHPQVRFVSTEIALIDDTTARVEGDLTIRGETRPMTLTVEFNGSARDPLRGNRQVIGFSAQGVFTRSEWGADAYTNFGVGDEVEVLIEAEFLRQ